MADDGASGASGSAASDPQSTSIEINIKTLESQVHKLRVDKNETVLNLKEKIVDVAGVPVEQQRLIFRGRVLKDDHPLSEYHLEDGYTLHLVARRTAEGQQSSGTSEENTHANVNVAENGGMLGDYMSRTVRDILGTLGLGMPGGVANATFSVPLNTAPNGTTTNGRTHPGNPPPPGFSILNHQIHVSQLQGGAIPRNMVIPDSMMTIMEYINRMDQVLQNNGVPSADSNAQQPPRSDDANLNQRFPSPEVLVSVLERAQQVLGGSASSALSHLAERIQRDAGTTDTSIRSQIQSESAHLGVAMQHLGAMLLELGRTMMMLRMGPTPANAYVNAGSAVYINPTGPNPIMVQPSYQNSPHFGVSSIPVLSGVSGSFGIVDPSRTSGGASATSPSVGSTTADGESQNAARTQGDNPPANSTHGLPPRTAVAAIPGFLARSSGPNNVLGVILPVQMRGQVAAPNQSTAFQGSQNAVGSGPQPNSTYAVPQASSGGAANISSIVAQITAQVANALAANQQGMVSSSVPNTAAQGPHPATNTGAGTVSSATSGTSSGGAANISSIVAQITTQVANALAANQQGMVSSPVPNTAAQGTHPTTNTGAGTVSSATSGNTQLQSEVLGSHHGQTLPGVQSHVSGAGTLHSNTSEPSLTPQDSSTVNVSSVDVDNIGTHSRELEAASLAGQLTDTSADDVPVSTSAENSQPKNKPLDGVTGESTKPTASGRSGPLGLGGGLQPKRRSRVAKPSETSGDSGEVLDTTSISRSQEAVLMGQQALQALVTKSTNTSSSSVTNSRPASSTPQAAAGLPPRRPGGEGQVDIGSMLSSVLNSPVFGNLMSNVAAQTGLESPADVRNIMEDLTQNPAVMDTLSNMVQGVDGPRRGQGGGFDLSRMMQQMMPVMSQVLGGGAARPAGTESENSRLQPRQNDREVRDAVDGRSSEIDLHEARECIEQCDPPEDIFGAVLETAAQAYGEDENIQFMLEEIASDRELAEDYLKLLLEQVGERVESESETRKQP